MLLEVCEIMICLKDFSKNKVTNTLMSKRLFFLRRVYGT
jgi:hypothetical protein